MRAKATAPDSIRPRLVVPVRPRQLGDILQELARISPQDVHALTLIARDALRLAKKRHTRYFPNDI